MTQRTPDPRTLLDWFTDSVARVPDRPALVVGDTELTYAELDAAARAAAHRVPRTGARPPCVALPATRTAATYVGYLAILYAGGTVVPLHPGHPAERHRRTLELAGADAVVADSEADTAFAREAGVPVVPLAPDDLRARPPREEPGPRPGPDDVAYVLFTSGSTGTPKGVPIRHANVDAFLRYNIERYGVGPGCRLSQTFGLTFDPSVFDLFVAWGGGATLVVPGREDLVDPVTFVAERGITHWYSVPSIISLARGTGSLTPGSMPALRWSLFAGEQLTLDHAAAWAAAAPRSTLENLYGPTELTVTVTAYRLPPHPADWPATSNGTVPIGTVYPHLEHRVVPGTGELQVRGPQRFDGYLDPADNAGRFAEAAGAVPGPQAWYRTGDRVAGQDGELVHLGRLDHQVKVLGQRVELGEIEAALRTWGGLRDAVALVHGADDAAQLVAVYSGQEVPVAELRRRMRSRVPAHMIPKRVLRQENLPLNASGKIDRAACSALLRQP
ncbi:AMP-binding protein [Streptomyces cyaneofuscatus]|uniref:AMP-binding protein n=1 Tax=Streptomyces cyaneofuscatus TaxID=66883 RepID=UPI0037FCE67E